MLRRTPLNIHLLRRKRQFWGSRSDVEAIPEGGRGLPTPQEAQLLPVVRIPNFLTPEEMKEVIETSLAIRRDGAGSVLLQADPWDKNDHYGEDRGDWCTNPTVAHC